MRSFTTKIVSLFGLLGLLFAYSCEKDIKVPSSPSKTICNGWKHFEIKNKYFPESARMSIIDIATTGNSILMLVHKVQGGGSCRYVYVSNDNGESWEIERCYDTASGESLPRKFFVVNENCIYMIFSRGGNAIHSPIAVSKSGGNGWSPRQDPECCGKKAKSLYFFTEDDGLMAMTNGTLVRTNDGGKNWDSLLNMGDNIRAMDFPENNHIGYAITMDTFYKTTDSGTTWTEVYHKNKKGLRKMKFFDINHGMIAGDDLLMTTNGGEFWYGPTQPDLKHTDITGITFLDKPDKMAVATYSGVFITSDHGHNWTEICDFGKNGFILKELASNTNNSIFAGMDVGVNKDTLRYYLLKY